MKKRKKEITTEFIIDFFVRPIINFFIKEHEIKNTEFKTTIGKLKI